MFVDEKKQGEVAIDPVLDILFKARERVKRGWCQGVGHTQESDQDLVCAGYAISETFSCEKQKDGEREAYEILTRALGFVSFLPVASVVNWNDAIGRTKADIIAGFDKAIALRQKSA